MVGEPVARAVDAALDRADRAAADLRRLLVGKAGRPDQDQRLALVVGKLRERRAKVLHVHMAVLLGMGREPRRIAAVGVLDLAPPLAALGEIGVAQDGEEPGLEVGPFLERLQMVPGLEQRFLHEIVGALLVAAKRNGESAQAADFCHELVSQG